jgi:hypothetical protein
MPITDLTPFRQVVRAYSALLNINDTISKLPVQHRDAMRDAMGTSMPGTEKELAGIRDALATPSPKIENVVAALQERVETLERSFNQRVAGALREHIYLPPTSHWSVDKPFLPFSTCSAADFIHPKYAELCAALAHPVQFHRKLWEWVFVLHHMDQLGVLKEGSRGVGFGIGTERLPSVFANRGATITATDAPPEIGVSSGWTATGQHSDSLAELFYPELITNEAFAERVSHRFCDMNAIDPALSGFDFTWSCCCFEHLGSLEAGIRFVINSVEQTLKPGGVAVHTTEFNLSSNDDTIESGPTVLYRQCDMESLVQRLRDLGHDVQPFVIAPDSHFLDFHVDMPPYSDQPHLKLKFGSYVTTSVGVVIRKRLS